MCKNAVVPTASFHRVGGCETFIGTKSLVIRSIAAGETSGQRRTDPAFKGIFAISKCNFMPGSIATFVFTAEPEPHILL